MPPPDASADLRRLQLLWGALLAGVTLMVGVLGGLAITRQSAAAESAALLFYLDAALSMGAVAAAFWVQQRLVRRLPACDTYAEVLQAIRTDGLISAALLEASALFAVVVTFLTGELINLLFVLPFYGFAALFFPTRARFAYLLEVAERG